MLPHGACVCAVVSVRKNALTSKHFCSWYNIRIKPFRRDIKGERKNAFNALYVRDMLYFGRVHM